MTEKNAMPEIDSEIPRNAVSVYGESGMDDFPVLKAFQHYIDAEQAKARKRMLALCAVFGIVLAIVIAACAVILVNISNRNQLLNDRLVEFAMKERAASAVVVQPPQDNATLLALTAKLDEMQKKLTDERIKADRAAAEAARIAAEAAKPKGPTKEELEIQRLNALLKAEKEKAAADAEKRKAEEKAEKERRKQEELEAYRRKYYPELYAKPKPVSKPKRKVIIEDLEDDNSLLDDDSAISYFDSDGEEEEIIVRKPQRKAKPTKKAAKPVQETEAPAVKTDYTIPVEVRGKSTSWSIPND